MERGERISYAFVHTCACRRVEVGVEMERSVTETSSILKELERFVNSSTW